MHTHHNHDYGQQSKAAANNEQAQQLHRTASFVNNRPEAIVQQALQHHIDQTALSVNPPADAVIQGNFNPADYNITVNPSPNDILLRALQVVMESPQYSGMVAETIRDRGGATVAMDTEMDHPAHWDKSTRTIRINPNRLGNAKMVIANALAFELVNAVQTERIDSVLARVRSGEINTAADYAFAIEQIEYQSARYRAEASLAMIREGKWDADSTLRHFMDKGEVLEYGFSPLRIVGDGLWKNFEGFYQTQLLNGHAERIMGRFEELPQRKEYLKNKEIEEARQRYLLRKAKREGGGMDKEESKKSEEGKKEEHRSTGPGLGEMIQVTDPSAFLHHSELTRIWQDGNIGKDYRGRDGAHYRLAACVEGIFYFRKHG